MEQEPKSFPASAYHPDLGNEVATGQISISQWILRFSSPNATVDLPLDGLAVYVPKTDSERIVFQNSSKQPGWTVYSYDFDVLEDRYLQGRTAIRSQIRKITHTEYGWSKLLSITVGVFAVFMVVAFVLFQAAGWTVNFLVDKVPTTYEKKIGQDVFKEMEESILFVKNTNAVREIEDMAKKFIPAAEQKRFDFKFHIIDEAEPNAMALPGGIILVTTGLLELLETPDELASVLAHEAAHVTKRHGVKHIISQVGPYILLKAFLRDDSGFLGAIGHGSGFLISQNFSQNYETEADLVGWDYLTSANINPQAAISALKKLQGGHIELDVRIERVLSSHPPTSDRVRRLEGKWTKLKKKTGYIQLTEPDLKKWK